MHAFLVYVRPIVEYNTIIWSPSTARGIDALESVQRRFTKRLLGFKYLPYCERLKRLNVPSLELRRHYTDLFWCYKIVFGLVNVKSDDFLALSPCILLLVDINIIYHIIYLFAQMFMRNSK